MMNTLVLDKNKQMVKMVPWEEAISNVVRGKAEVLLMRQNKPRIIYLKDFSLQDIDKKVKVKRLGVGLLLQRDDHRCQYCGKPLDRTTVTQDHVVPWSKGGQTVSTNLVCACLQCNRKKDDRTLQESGMRLLKPVKQIKMFDSTRQMRQVYQNFFKLSSAT